MENAQQALITTNVLKRYAELVEELGGNPATYLELSGIRATLPETRFITQASWTNALNLAATELPSPQFGLLLSQRIEVKEFGPLAYHIRSAPTVRDALVEFDKYIRGLSTATSSCLEVGGDFSLWRYELEMFDAPSLTQQIDLAVGHGLVIMRTLIDRSWNPSAIHFAHSPPRNRGVYERICKCPCFFDCTFTAIEISPNTLDHDVSSKDEDLHALTGAHLTSSSWDIPRGMVARVTDVLKPGHEEGLPDLSDVAAELNVPPRSIQRGLRAEGTNFRTLLDAARNECARRYLLNTSLSINEVALLTGFQQVSSFVRFFKRMNGTTPLKWRRGGIG